MSSRVWSGNELLNWAFKSFVALTSGIVGSAACNNTANADAILIDQRAAFY